MLIFFPKLNYLDKNLQEILCKFHFLFNIVFLSLVKVCHGQGKLGGKRKLFKVGEKAGNFFQWKVREFCVPVYSCKFSSSVWSAFAFGKDER